MKNQFRFLLLLTSFVLACKAIPSSEPETLIQTVYESGMEGYSHFRIPVLIKIEQQLFAFAEGRQNSVHDNGDISIVLRRSQDDGKSWGELIRVVEIDNESAQNPMPVYVEEEQKLILLFTKRTVGEDTERMLRDGSAKGYVGVYQMESFDQGLTWSAVKEITAVVKQDNWRWYALGPGGAIRLKYNRQHSGRIVLPANHSVDLGSENDFLGGHVVYSDDGGKTWQIGALDSEGMSTINPSETTVVELKDGRLYFNTRNHSSVDTIANRAITYSEDGGASFTAKFHHEKQLVTPVVHASLTRNKHTLFFVAPFDKQARKDLSLWTSTDEGQHWKYDRLLYQGPSAYSSICMIDENWLGALYEVDDYNRIVFRKVNVR
ncbi:MAG: sialidase family protein [Saprospiraceae bacterium]|nr:exo-alpha-sialidase [Lewinella sp.]